MLSRRSVVILPTSSVVDLAMVSFTLTRSLESRILLPTASAAELKKEQLSLSLFLQVVLTVLGCQVI